MAFKSIFLLFFLVSNNLVLDGQENDTSDWLLFEFEAIALRSKIVHSELELSDTQAKKMEDVASDALGKVMFWGKRLRESEKGSERYQAFLEKGNTIVADARREFRDVALGFQQKRLSQIARQYRYFSAIGLNVKAFKEDFKVSKQQEDDFSEVNKEFSKELKNLREEYEKKAKALFRRKMVDFKKELKPKQAKEFQDFFGEPFTPMINYIFR